MENHRLTKREKYLLKKERKEQKRFQKMRRKKIKKIFLISLILLLGVLIIGGAVFRISKHLSRKETENNQGIAKIEISPKEYNAGTVSMANGLVKRTYEIKNTGKGDLKIRDIKTSCMCTTARLKIGDKESPKFGMHNNPKFWSQKIAPGETGFLEVTFDPAFHGAKGTGQIVRAVYLSTNDPKNEKVEVKLIANVIE